MLIDLRAEMDASYDPEYHGRLRARVWDALRDTPYVRAFLLFPGATICVGLVSGALDAGSDADAAFEALQAEVGRLYHEKRALRSRLLVYVAVGWTTALLVVGIVVAVNAYVLDGFAQLSTVSGGSGITIDPNAVDPPRDRYRFYVVTQATMLACGWFAGTASRGIYEALLHSSGLVLIAYVVFAGAGLI